MNIRHLFEIRRAKPWRKRGERRFLTAAQVADIKMHLALGTASQAALAREYRVATSTIHSIKRGNSWRAVPPAED